MPAKTGPFVPVFCKDTTAERLSFAENTKRQSSHIVNTATMLLAVLEETDEDDSSEAVMSPLEASPPLARQAVLIRRFGRFPSNHPRNPQSVKTGLDFAVHSGASVFSVRPGEVVHVVKDGQKIDGFNTRGRTIVIYHKDEDVWSTYSNLSVVFVAPGMKIAAGQIIGQVGYSANANYSEPYSILHFESYIRNPDEEQNQDVKVKNQDPELWLMSYGIFYNEQGELWTIWDDELDENSVRTQMSFLLNI